MTILDRIVEKTKERVAQAKTRLPITELMQKAKALSSHRAFVFETALKKPQIGFICEIKKASPSKGLIAPDFSPVNIAKEYAAAGADCLSVLTEPDFFMGADTYLQDVRQAVGLPLLRKDFIIDAYQIYEAKLLGADAVLLICAILDQQTLCDFLQIAHSLGLSVLVEAHSEEEVAMALRAGARMVGVNNRDLKTFTVDIENGLRLRAQVPEDVVFVSESGIETRGDVARLEDAGVHAVLIGETLMRADDKCAALNVLRGGSL